jgi:hypothetical protein
VLKPSLTFKQMLAVTTAFSLGLPILPAAAQDDTSTATPPARVGEIAAVTGSVNFNGAGSNGQWVAATANYPLTTGDSVFTQPDAQATLAVDSSQLTLSGNTELQVTSLDNNTLAATASQGETFLAINYLQPGQSFDITTPRGTVTISQNGNYDIAAGDTNDPTVVTVLAGAATVTDPGATLQVAAGQEAVLTGTDQTTAQLGDAQRDAFINAMLAEQAPPPPAYAPPVVQQMTGVSELSNYGSWNQDPTYGAVWYPQVDSGWAPYHVGHWAYVAPWGYTWVDAAPWGFAPFHYGRWIDVNDRWGWAPAPAWSPGGGYGADYQPVYAPALVSFFGVGVGVGLAAGALASGSIGWVPLGPNEPYYPPYHHSPQYLQRINYVNVRNINEVNIHNTTIINNYNTYVNRRAAVYVPADALSRGEMVSHYAHPVAEADFAKARPVGFAAPNGGRAEALPPPAMVHRAVEAPRLDTFAQRRSLPPAIISHEPAPAIHPGEAYAGPHPGAPAMGETHPAMMTQPAHPFSTMPGYHAPPPPPGMGAHIGQAAPEHFGSPSAPSEMHLPNGVPHPPAPPGGKMNHPENPAYHPPGEPQFHQNTPAFHPPAEPQFHQNAPAYHPPAEPQFHPAAPAYHPPAEPQFHPSAPAYHPPAEPQDHPAAPAYHPPAQPQFHPTAPAFHPPAPHPAPPPPQHPDEKKPG